MKKIYIVILLSVLGITGLQAQQAGGVILGTDVVKGANVIQGTKISSLTTAERNQLVISPSIGVIIFNTDTGCQEYWNGEVWISLCAGGQNWFYMPSFNLPVTAVGTGLTVDLYAEYKRQFTKTGNTQFVSSNASSATIPPLVYAANKLDYFVTAYPAGVLKINSIDANGVMNYDVLSTNVPEDSFINVLFAVKQ